MAIDQGTTTLAVTSQERTWRVNIETAKGADPVVTVYREEVKTDAGGTVISKTNTTSTSRSLSAIAAETQSFTPATSGSITMAELAKLIADRADMWRTEDIATAVAPIKN